MPSPADVRSQVDGPSRGWISTTYLLLLLREHEIGSFGANSLGQHRSIGLFYCRCCRGDFGGVLLFTLHFRACARPTSLLRPCPVRALDHNRILVPAALRNSFVQAPVPGD